MPFHQLILAFLTGILFSYSVQSFGKAAIITRSTDKHFWLGLTLLSGSIYITLQLFLTVPSDSETMVSIHRLKILALLFTVTGWIHTFYRISFPSSRYPMIFTILAGITALFIPFDLFLDLPISSIRTEFLGIPFTHHFATTGPVYLFMSFLILIPFSIIPILTYILNSNFSRREKAFGCLVFSPGLIGGLNDFAVTNHLYSGIMISEYVFFIFLAGVSIHLFREDASNHRFLKNLKTELEKKIDQRTAELKEANHQLQAMASTDLLTGLCNRREFTHILTQEESRIKRYQGTEPHTFSILFIDLDNFKYYNDTFGHAAGDLVLAGFASLLKGMLRTPDTAARYGGDEFVALLPSTGEGGAVALAQRILTELKSLAGFQKEIARLTGQDRTIPVEKQVGCSIGVATYNSTSLNESEAILIAADRALYAAKSAGKHRVKVWRPDDGGHT